MFRFFQDKGAVTLVGVIVLLVLAIACSAPAPTATPIPTPTPTVVPTPPPYVGSWVLFEETDPITDFRVLGVRLFASESTVEFPYDPPQIAVYCLYSPGESPETQVAIFWQEHLGSGNNDVNWRVDDKRPWTTPWHITGTITTPPKRTNVAKYFNDLRQAQKISARVHRDFAESLTAVWEPEGFTEAYKPVEEACKR